MSTCSLTAPLLSHSCLDPASGPWTAVTQVHSTSPIHPLPGCGHVVQPLPRCLAGRQPSGLFQWNWPTDMDLWIPCDIYMFQNIIHFFQLLGSKKPFSCPVGHTDTGMGLSGLWVGGELMTLWVRAWVGGLGDPGGEGGLDEDDRGGPVRACGPWRAAGLCVETAWSALSWWLASPWFGLCAIRWSSGINVEE